MNSKLFNLFKNKVALTIALLTFIILGAGAMMAMKAPDAYKAKSPTEKGNKKHIATKKRSLQTWYFNGNDIDNVKTASFYGSSPSASCGTGTDLPCEIQYDSATYSTLADYLAANSATTILTNAVSKKEEAP